MSLKKSFSGFVVFSICVISTLAQKPVYSTTNKKAIKYYEQAVEQLEIERNLDASLESLSKALTQDPVFVEANKKTGDIFYIYFKDDVKAEKYYTKVVNSQTTNPFMVGAFMNLSKIHIEKMNFEAAIDVLQDVVQMDGLGVRIKSEADDLLLKSKFAKTMVENAYDFEPRMLPRNTVNQFQIQSNPVLTADQMEMIYSVKLNLRMDENIVISRKDEKGNWTKPISISDNINTDLNEGAATISGDGKTLVFSSCGKKDSKGSCDLYISYRNGEEWSVPENMGDKVNSGAWESNPSITADGKTIYFSSERAGGQGKKDIWVTNRLSGNLWSAPENLGPKINTKENEATPFIHADKQHLYFASDGYWGMGGYDIFYSIKDDVFWSDPINVGYPINTPDNEGAFYVTPDYEKGYYEKYVSDYEMSHSEIFEFDIPSVLKSKYKTVYAKGNVFDFDTKKPLSAKIELIDLKSGLVIQSVKSDSINGNYLVVLTEGKEYALHVKSPNYLFYSDNFDFTTGNFDPLKLDIYLRQLSSKQSITLKNIFFETDKFSLQEKSFLELDKLAEVLKASSSVKVEIGGFTDNVGGIKHNQMLSLNRAQSVYEYLIKSGVSQAQLTYKGYGADNPIGDNKTEEGRKLNRRIELKIR